MHDFTTKAVATLAGYEVDPSLSHSYATPLRCSITLTQKIDMCKLATS